MRFYWLVFGTLLIKGGLNFRQIKIQAFKILSKLQFFIIFFLKFWNFFWSQSVLPLKTVKNLVGLKLSFVVNGYEKIKKNKAFRSHFLRFF